MGLRSNSVGPNWGTPTRSLDVYSRLKAKVFPGRAVKACRMAGGGQAEVVKA